MNIGIAIIIFSLIIIIHEIGHFLFAKKNGIVVTEFSVGMGPRIISFNKGGTKYSLKILPFGGSCMMLGEDEDIDGEGTFNSKGVWARISVIAAGPIFNFILAFMLSLILIAQLGVDIPFVTMIDESGPAQESGLEEGDIITKIDGTSISVGREIDFYLQFTPITDKPVNITYLRNGKKENIQIAPVLKETYLVGFTYSQDKTEVLEIIEDYPFANAGIKVGDRITKIDDFEIKTGNDIAKYFKENPLSGKEVSVTYIRNNSESTVKVLPKLRTEYNMGWDFNIYREKVSPLRVLKYSLKEVKFNIVSTIKSLGLLITGKVGMNQISGPVGVVKVMDDIYEGTKQYGWQIVILGLINFSILLSANLGVMNLLPIPALDGGRLVFLLVEAVRGKPIDREKEGMVHFIGIVALMILMVFVLFNDIRNFF